MLRKTAVTRPFWVRTVTAMNLYMHTATATDTAELTGVTGWAVSLMETLGAPGAGLAVAAENLFPPIPSEVILPLAGFTAARGDLSLAAALVWTTAGSIFGALLLYFLGRAFGRRRMYAVAERLPLVQVQDLERSETWFARHGTKAVLFGRMVPIVRSLISVPAGVEAMPVGRFVVLTAIGSALWNSVFVLAGYGLGEHWTVVETYASVLQKLVISGTALAVVVFATRRLTKSRAGRRDVGPNRTSPADNLGQ